MNEAEAEDPTAPNCLWGSRSVDQDVGPALHVSLAVASWADARLLGTPAVDTPPWKCYIWENIPAS